MGIRVVRLRGLGGVAAKPSRGHACVTRVRASRRRVFDAALRASDAGEGVGEGEACPYFVFAAGSAEGNDHGCPAPV